MYSFRQLLKNRILALVLAIGVMACLASVAYCAGISQDQKDQLKNLATQTRQKAKAERQKLMHARRELFEAYRNYDLNEKKAKAAIEKIDQSQLKLLYIHLENQVGIRDILNVNQFAELRNRVCNKMRGHRPGAMTPIGEDSLDNLVDKTIREDINLSADQQQKASQLSNLAKQKNNIAKKLRRDSKQMVDMYVVYNLDPSVAKMLINSIHRQQSSLLNINFKKQQALREVLSESQFNALASKFYN